MVFYKCLKLVPDNSHYQQCLLSDTNYQLRKLIKTNYLIILAIFVPVVVLAFTTYTPEASEATSK